MQNRPDRLQFWKLITIVFTLISIVALGIFGFQQRQPIALQIVGKRVNLDSGRMPAPSDASISELQDFTEAGGNIMGINVIRVDFRMNTRNTTFRHFKEPAVTAAWEKFLETQQVAPLFGSNEQTNQRLINLINGQFLCVNTTNTVAAQLIPEVASHSQTTCMAPIPPGYGDFVGFINVFLRKAPSVQEITELEESTRKLAIDIYERDVVKTKK
jgi:hypothetical protein